MGKGALVVASRQVHSGERPLRRGHVTHGFAALAFYSGGRARVELKGEWKLEQGDVLIVPAGQPHRMLEVERPELWKLAFCVPCLAADGATALLEPFERVRGGASPVVHMPSDRVDFLEGLFRELERLGAGKAPNDTAHVVQKSLLTLILAEVERAARTSGAARAKGGVVVEALRFIERNCLGELSVDDVATAVDRTPSYVTTALKQATGRGAGQWIVSGRMAEARRLLLHSDEKIDVIAGRVGYADATHFIRMFRREHGATPAAWRAAQARSSGGA